MYRIREMLKDKAPSALNNMVEVDETYVGGKLANKHKKVRKAAATQKHNKNMNKTAVVALLERNHKVRTYVWPATDTIPLKDMVRQAVSFEAIIVTDAHYSYRGLVNEYKGHDMVNHSQDEYVRGQWHTNTAEGFFSILKRGIYGICHQVSRKHLQLLR